MAVDPAVIRRTLQSLSRAALVATAVAFVISLVNIPLPFVSFTELPGEVLSRTRANPLDLAVSLVGGLAGAYVIANRRVTGAMPGVAIAVALMPPLCTIGIGAAVGRWDVSFGALVLVITNAVTIVFGAAVVFFLLGFGKDVPESWLAPRRGLLVSGLLTVLMFAVVVWVSVNVVTGASSQQVARKAVQDEVRKIEGAEVVSVDVRPGDPTRVVVTLRTTQPLTLQDAADLQQRVTDQLDQIWTSRSARCSPSSSTQ